MSEAAKSTMPFSQFVRPDVEPVGEYETRMPNCSTLTRIASIAFADHDEPSPVICW